MNGRLKGGLVAAAAVAALASGGAAIAGATGGGSDTAMAPATGGGDSATADAAGRDDGPGQPITGSALDKAKSVALQETGGGQVTGSEIRDEEGYYEVEVTRSDRGQVDVHMDRNYNVLDAQSDGSGADESGSNG